MFEEGLTNFRRIADVLGRFDVARLGSKMFEDS